MGLCKLIHKIGGLMLAGIINRLEHRTEQMTTL
jgi:hypothetical protein